MRWKNKFDRLKQALLREVTTPTKLHALPHELGNGFTHASDSYQTTCAEKVHPAPREKERPSVGILTDFLALRSHWHSHSALLSYVSCIFCRSLSLPSRNYRHVTILLL